MGRSPTGAVDQPQARQPPSHILPGPDTPLFLSRTTKSRIDASGRRMEGDGNRLPGALRACTEPSLNHVPIQVAQWNVDNQNAN